MTKKRRLDDIIKSNKRRRTSMFNITNVVKTEEFKNIRDTINQEEYYRKNNSPDDILKLVKLSNKAFGEKIQSIIQELLYLEKSNDSGHDAVYNTIKFEIKSSRYSIRNKDFTWQHIMEEHDYDYLILVGIDFFDLKVFIISKNDFLLLKTDRVKMQGGGEGQGLWCTYKQIQTYLYELNNRREFLNFIN